MAASNSFEACLEAWYIFFFSFFGLSWLKNQNLELRFSWGEDEKKKKIGRFDLGQQVLAKKKSFGDA